jgi:hypothetical protein
MGEQPGFSAEEIERGEDEAWHIPMWGCLAVLALIAIVGLVIWRAIATRTGF